MDITLGLGWRYAPMAARETAAPAETGAVIGDSRAFWTTSEGARMLFATVVDESALPFEATLSDEGAAPVLSAGGEAFAFFRFFSRPIK